MEIEVPKVSQDSQPLLKAEPACTAWLLETCCCLLANQTGVTENFVYPPCCSCSCFLLHHLINPLCLYCTCCAHSFASEKPMTIVWLGDVHVIGGIKYGEWKDISDSLRYTCPLSGRFNKETIQKMGYLGVYSCCLPYIISGCVLPPLTMCCNCWNGSLLLTSLQKKGYEYDHICSMFGLVCCISIPHKHVTMEKDYFIMDLANFSDWCRPFCCMCCSKPESRYVSDHQKLEYKDEDFMNVKNEFGLSINHSSVTTTYSDGSKTFDSVTVDVDFNHSHFVAKNAAEDKNGMVSCPVKEAIVIS
jgi:hypothetical protein